MTSIKFAVINPRPEARVIAASVSIGGRWKTVCEMGPAAPLFQKILEVGLKGVGPQEFILGALAPGFEEVMFLVSGRGDQAHEYRDLAKRCGISFEPERLDLRAADYALRIAIPVFLRSCAVALRKTRRLEGGEKLLLEVEKEMAESGSFASEEEAQAAYYRLSTPRPGARKKDLEHAINFVAENCDEGDVRIRELVVAREALQRTERRTVLGIESLVRIEVDRMILIYEGMYPKAAYRRLEKVGKPTNREWQETLSASKEEAAAEIRALVSATKDEVSAITK